MSATDRQNRLLLAEDWQTVYQSFKYADFKSYDFDNLRRTMIDYLRKNYPEDFNDYIESSEYLALIDMIAFLGQNISFRVDLNARENFIELAERRESVLRLARLISYNPTRNQPANGLLKFTSVQTTENVIDSDGTNLAARTIKWNDNVNANWYEQFIKILNASFTATNKYGTPRKSESIEGVPTEKYKFNSTPSVFPVFGFQKPVNGKSLDFEIVSTDIHNGEIIEEPPKAGNQVGLLYRDNGQGAGSSNTGFFMHFRQGVLQKGEFTVNSPVPNQRIDIDAANINQEDVWLFKLNNDASQGNQWTKVDAVEGNNIIYNSISKNIRNIFSVLTRVDDRISLIFSDGIFGELPAGTFRTFYRTSQNADFTITPNNLKNIKVNIPYISATGKTETLTVQLSLRDTIQNASSSETTESIKTNAPSTYYTQNRLITGEDYNVGPLGISQDIIKAKAVNRTSSGINRYYDLRDSTGKYSTTNLFGTDGALYKEEKEEKYSFNFVTTTDIEAVIEGLVTELTNDTNVRNFYYDNFLDQNYTDLNLVWMQQTNSLNRSTGYIVDSANVGDTDPFTYTVGAYTQGPLRFFEVGALVKFDAPTGRCFDKNNAIQNRTPAQLGDKSSIWTKVISIETDGTTETSTGLGPIVFNDVIPTSAILKNIKLKFVRDILSVVKSEMIAQVFAYRTFGLRYDREDRNWYVITQDNVNIKDSFNIGLAGDNSGQSLDRSWILLFETTGVDYTITARTTRYIFESNSEIRFFYDSNKKIYDSKSGNIIRDKISVLSINNDLASINETSPLTRNFDWAVSKEYRDDIGYVNSKKVEVVFFDSDDDGVVDNPEIFENIVVPNTNAATKIVFTKRFTEYDTEYWKYVEPTAENIVIVQSQPNTVTPGNPVFYVIDTDSFYQLTSASRTLIEIFNYKAYTGRDNIKFQYVHASDENARVDPSSSNIIDTYLLTKQYDTNFRQFLKGVVATKPLPASSDQLYRSYGSAINAIKSISDEVIYHPVKYKVLFGNNAETDLQATFKLVKNKNRVVNDNELKTRVIDSINEYFSLENWDFGETFYWSELSSYIMKQLAPDLSSIVLVPNSGQSSFGSLFELKSENDEILISGATVNNVEIISAITAERLKASGTVITEVNATGEVVESTTYTISTGSSQSEGYN